MESGEDAGASVANRNKSPTGPNSWTVDGTGVGADVVNIARCCCPTFHFTKIMQKPP